MPLRQATSLEAFLADPVGTWVVAATSIAWCASPSLVGATIWGRPDNDSTRSILRPFEGLWADPVSERVDVLIDASRVESIDAAALGAVIGWTAARRAAIVRRVRQQIGVVAPGLVGITLAGILPIIGDTHPFRVVHDPFEAYVALAGAGGSLLGSQVQSLVELHSGIAPEVRKLRELLQAKLGSLEIIEAARLLRISTRSLQRSLQMHGTSFQAERRDARFTAAHELLFSTDEKVAAIARHVGVTEGALTLLFRERTGKTPAELRRERIAAARAPAA